MEQGHVVPPNLYPLGSRGRSLFRFSWLIVSASGVLAILHLVILQLFRHFLGDGPENTFFSVCVLAGGIFGVATEGWFFRRIPRWLAFVVKDSAAGFVDPVGLHYRLLFGWQGAPWTDISRIEYFAGDNGRIHIYIFGRQFPLRFGPTDEQGRMPTLADFLKNQMQKSKRDFIEHRNSALRETNGAGNRELVAKALITLSVLIWLGVFNLFQYYRDTRPRVPQAAQGRIYEQNSRGYVIYLTADEKNLLHVLEFSAPLLLLAGVLLDPRRRIWQRAASAHL